MSEIVSAIVGGPVTAAHVSGDAPGSSVLERFDLVMPDARRQVLDVADHLWAPNNYVALARHAVIAPARGRIAPVRNELLATLTTPRIETLLAANAEISSRIASNAPGAHDDAALLLATFALREAAGAFSDTRPALCAIAAHLAIARALGDAPDRNARAAELTLLVLIGRERDAVQRLNEWKAAAPKDGAEQSWIAALLMRATGDWRLLKEPARASLLERLAYVHSVRDRLGANRAMDFLDDSHPEAVADWTRIMTGGGMTVESGNALTLPAVTMELEETELVWRALHRGAPALNDLPPLIDALNARPSRDRRDDLVITWPMFAASYQRHLAMKLAAAVNHVASTLARKDAGRELARNAETSFGRLMLYPLAKRHYAVDEPQYREAVTAAAPLWSEHPELITSGNWTLLSERWSSARIPDDVPSGPGWFRPLTPVGTAYDAANRMFGPKRSLIMQRNDLERVRKMAPSETAALFELARIRFGAKPPVASLQADAGALAEYDLSVAYRLAAAAAADVAVYRPIGRRICELDADGCATLAAYLADHDLDEEAAEVYQHFADTARDRVMMGNLIEWLIVYYDEHGQRPRAIALADEAGEVFSYRGLATKARMLERLERYDEAEAYFRKAFERYTRPPIDLAAFYLRHSHGLDAARYRDLAEPFVKKVFPRGLERVGERTPEQAPLDGVRVRATGARGAAAGFTGEDIIVAVDGVSVHNLDQLQLVWRMSADPTIAFVVWRGARYVDLHGPLRLKWVSGDLTSYDYRKPILW